MSTSQPKMKIHAICKLYPGMQTDEFRTLKSSIEQIGQQQPITLLNDEILDGKNRYRAIMELGLNPKFEHFDQNGDVTPLNFVLSQHTRRNLTTSQRSLIAAKMSNLKQGRQSKSSNEPFNKVSLEHAAKSQGVSVSSIKRCKAVLKERPNSESDIANGKITVAELVVKISNEKAEARYKAAQKAAKKMKKEAREKEKEYQKNGNAGTLPTAEQKQFDADKLAEKQAKEKEKSDDARLEIETALENANYMFDEVFNAIDICGLAEFKEIIGKQPDSLMEFSANLAKIGSLFKQESIDDQEAA